MLKRIRVDIRSEIDELDQAGLPEGEPEISNESHTASLLVQGGEYRIGYSTDTEGGKLSTDVRVSAEGEVTVARRGAIDSVMVFANGKVFDTVYTVPPYKFDMQIKTQRLRTELSEHGGRIDILYLMTVGGAPKRCRMTITLEDKK